MIPITDKNKLRDFSRLCKEHNITFIDMSDDFIAAYNKEKIVPYGFSNTIPGEGHLNKYGHEIIAERLSKTIDEMEQGATE
jgi:lysophospholipase L1-like esterase